MKSPLERISMSVEAKHGRPTSNSAMRVLARLPYRELITFAGAISADVDKIAEALDRFDTINGLDGLDIGDR